MDILLKDIAFDSRPEKYIPSQALVQAAILAYALKRPLLLSGEPGTGKTEFARFAAQNLSENYKHFLPEPLIFNTKSSSAAQDLFYHYDAVAHFRSNSTSAQPKSTEDFIRLKALGLAFAHAIGKNALTLSNTITARDKISETPAGRVVLIDEIDKAPRDFPNDLLNEIENFRFDLKEINEEIFLNDEQKRNIFVILTSNFEKNLPEAFLRRCVYFHIEFPDADALEKIILARVNISPADLGKLKSRINDFFAIRNDHPIQKKPSTSEAIDFIRAINDDKLLAEPLFDENKRLIQGSKLLAYLPVLLKKKEDLQLFSNNAAA